MLKGNISEALKTFYSQPRAHQWFAMTVFEDTNYYYSII